MFHLNFATIFDTLPPEIATILISMLPVAELRGAIPIAITVYGLDPILSYALSVGGNIIPAFFIIYLLGPVSKFLIKHFKIADKFFNWLFTRTRNRFSVKYQKWGILALTLFVAIPLPVTGVWTGSVAAFLFNIPKKTSLIYISFGAAIAGVIVTLATLGVVSIF